MKNKLEVGMYCYNNTNRKMGIGKIISFQSNNNINVRYKNDIGLVSIGNLKASNDITKLICVGDIITFKDDEDVYRVKCIPNKESACDCFYLVFDYVKPYGVEDIKVSIKTMQIALENIITKEQFESMSYRIGDKE